jgi:polyhydroxyalkanoate synthesis regulator phasin
MKIEIPNPVNGMLDAWVHSIGTLCWAQDQSESLVRGLMDQGQVAREEGRQLASQMAQRARANQAELQKFIHNSVALSLDSMQKAHESQIKAMQTRIDEMGAIIESLTQTATPKA